MSSFTRACALELQNYVNAIGQKDYTPPSDTALRAMKLLDESASRVFSQANSLLKSTPQFEKGVQALKKAPRTCGGFKDSKKALLKEFTPFEQQAVFSAWMEERGPSMLKRHTIALAAPDGGVVPVRIQPQPRYPTDLKYVILGTTKGELKGEKYEVWAKDDPQNSSQKVLIEPLNGLELYRQYHARKIYHQPSYIGALLLKANPYERGSIPHTWRYKVYDVRGRDAKEASVEVPHQKSSKALLIKEQSSGYNLARMMHEDSLRNRNLLVDLRWEKYHDDYNDDATAYVSPATIVRTLPDALNGITGPLDEEMARLFAARMGISEIPIVKQFAAERLFSHRD